ncbi:MAG TPA: cytochrome c oxidase subunit II, partial [Bdellovibrionales bacterium]|nr:cytochrome c oxidase subunit II [Bdellovibrionales bacterium]
MMWWLPLAKADSFMPPAATEIASQVDSIYAFLLWSSLVSFILLIGGMTFFVFKYKRKSATDKTAYITHNHTFEFLWSFIPFVLFIFSFAWGWVVYHEMRTFPENALEVHVVAKKWDWKFIYKNGKEITAGVDASGKKTPATMVIPVGRPVKVIMASEKINPAGDDPKDRPVLHSFFIPAFRVKQDVVPGRYTSLWFQAEKEGDFHLFCTEYCGAGHSAMLGMVKAVPVEEYERWLAAEAGAAGSLADQGRALYASKACIGCHSLDGTRVVGPSFKGIFGHEQAIEGGGSVKVDEDYLRESILNPNAKVAAGYPAGTMPPYAGQLNDDEVKALIEF